MILNHSCSTTIILDITGGVKNVDIMQYLDRGNVFSGWPFPLCSMLGGYDNQAWWEWPTTENIEWVSIFHYIKGSKQPWDSQYSNGAS